MVQKRGFASFLAVGLLSISLFSTQFASAYYDQVYGAQISAASLDEEMENPNYPIHPQDSVTTGALCDHPDSRRYAEGIAYCSRNVDSGTKKEIIRNYDATFKYKIQTMSRGDFKIDHLIPLCMGGANSVNNLWPQHKSVYTITDPLEAELCQKMSDGRLLQKDAVVIILKAKHNLGQVEEIRAQVRAL